MRLTARQRQIFTLRCELGLCRTEVAAQLGISLNTVKELCRQAYRRNGLLSAEQVCFRLERPVPSGTMRPEAV